MANNSVLLHLGLYRRLMAKMDELSFGYPKSYVWADLMFVGSIWSVQDAKDWLAMKDGYETAAGFAERNGISLEEATEKLERMTHKGEIFRRHCKDDYDTFEYERHPWAMGFMEWQIGNPNKNWFYSLFAYMLTSKLGKRMSQTLPFYRTVPMHKEFVEGSVVAPYDDVEAILDRHTRFAVAKCMCRLLKKVDPSAHCNHPLETCIETDDYATFYIETGLGREISKEEALAILREGEKDGRVINVTNSKDGENLCSCCECGCGMLWLKTHFPGPSKDFWSNHYCEVKEDSCIACGACVKKCPFHAIELVPGEQNKGRGVAKVNLDVCLGCGLCISACKKESLHLKKKDADRLYEPPEFYEDAVGEWTKITRKDYGSFK